MLIGANTIVRIYTPRKLTQQKIFHEFGEVGEIGDAGLPTRYHKTNDVLDTTNTELSQR